MTMVGSLFTGYGGLDRAACAVLPNARVIWTCDNDAAAARLLAHHHPQVPNLGDVTAVDWSHVDRPEVLVGGFPCQDVSLAGRRVGMRPGARSSLWEHMAHAVAALRPALVVIENVRGLLSARATVRNLEPCPWCMGDARDDVLRALGAVLGDLASLGYDAAWQGVRAADVGAAHERFRVFIVAADAEHDRRAGWCPDGARAKDERGQGFRAETAGRRAVVANADSVGPIRTESARRGEYGPTDGGGVVSDAEGNGRDQRRTAPERVERRSHVAVGGGAAADSIRPRLEIGRVESVACQCSAAERSCHGATVDIERERIRLAGQVTADVWGCYAPAVWRWERITRQAAPAPTVAGRRGATVLAPPFVEWLMGLPAGHVTGVPGLSRTEMLRLLGNGVVPLQAEAALRVLLPHIAPDAGWWAA